jgi:hypothetical protein
MKRQKAQHSNFGIFGTAVVTATLLGCTAIPQGALAGQTTDVAANGVSVAILTPIVNVTDSSKQIEISAFYQASAITGGVTTLELYVDGQQEAIKKLDTPENRGVVSFMINPGALTPGAHHVVVRVSASDAEIASAKTRLNIAPAATEALTPEPSLGGNNATGNAPAVSIMTPEGNATVTGTVDIKVDAHDNSGKSPYISLFVDHTFKTLKNFPPYEFAWDTTRVANGYHTIEVWGYNDDQAVGHAQPLTVLVNNPGGRTLVRHDLLDTVPTKVLINETRPRAAAVAHHTHSAVRASISLAQGESASSAKIEKLASADIDSQSSLSEQTQLMAPFIPTHTPTIERSAAVHPAHKAPSLAIRTASAEIGSNDQLSIVVPQTPDLEEAVTLAAPTIENMTPDTAQSVPQAIAPVMHMQAPITPAVKPVVKAATVTPVKPVAKAAIKPLPLVVKTIQAAAKSAAAIVTPTKVKPVQTASASITKQDIEPGLATTEQRHSDYFNRLDNAPVSDVAGDSSDMTLEEPAIEKASTNLKAVLASGKAASNIMLGATKLASASIGSSTLFSSGPTLQAPTLPGRTVLNIVSSHHVGSKLVPLGSSPSTFAKETIVRSQLVLNNHVVLLNQPMQDKSNMLFAPFRQIFENEGGVMSWNSVSHQVHAQNGSRDIEVTIGSKSATVNQQQVTLSATPYIVSGHTMIPLAFVPMALNATVNYDPATGHIVINSKD